ncbi:glycoside hydrolase 100 family protein [Pannus brasiliensis CCIBt3594]|uniref:beta-fructofuranosidase n=1 Tax=Pannus brasiliensis CCIBt3594 TaxID=1427578 RepID=A0AAW9QR86_9CHRO
MVTRISSPKRSRVSDADDLVELARSLLYEQALARVNGEFAGAVAAIPKRSSVAEGDLNYNEIFIRDNIPVMIYLLLDGKSEIVRNFLDICLKLQSAEFQTRGIFPTSFVEKEGRLVADYGQRAIGRVCSVDATLWWPILACIYVRYTGDRAWATRPEVQSGLHKVLELILHPGFRDSPTLYVPDGAFMIDRPMDVWGNPLEIQVLLYGTLLSSAFLLQIDLQERSNTPDDAFTESRIHQFRYAVAWAKRLRRYLLTHYWVNNQTIQILRRRPTEQYGESITNEHNIQAETIPHWLQDWLGDRGGYLIGNIRTGRPDFRFFTLGNCLGAIFDIISPAQQRSLFHLFFRNREALFAQMPLRICHPPLESKDWRITTGFDRKNLPWCYHNAGHWPCLLWFFVLAVLRYEERRGHFTEDGSAVVNPLLQESYELLLQRLPQQKWAEYFDGPTGVWIGQQARINQTWTIVGFLLVHHFLKVDPASVRIMTLPDLNSLTLPE